MSFLSAVLQTAEAAEEHNYRTLCANLCPQLREFSERARTLGCALRERLIESYVQYSPAPTRYQHDYRGRVGRLRADYERLAAEAAVLAEKECAGDDNTGELKRCSDDMYKAHEFLAGLTEAVEASEKVYTAGVAFRRADYGTAISALDEVRNALGKLKMEGEAGTALKNLRNTASINLALYATQMGSEWEEMLSWSERCGISHVTYSLLVRQSDSLWLNTLLQTMHTVNRLHNELSEFSEFFISKIVTGIINNTCEIFTDENVDTIIFNIKFDHSDSHRPTFQSIFNNLTAVFEFMQSTMNTSFPDGHTFITVLSQVISRRFFDLIISDCIKKYLPDCDNSYRQYKLLTSELDTFNKFLIDIKFVSKDCSPLDEYMDDSDCVLYKKKCDKLLTHVRRLLAESMSHSTVAVSGDVDPADLSVLNETQEKEAARDVVNHPLFLPRCVVSENVRRVLGLVVEHVNESCKLPELYSSLLVDYIKDIVVMYQTLVPSLYEVNLKNCPLDIALFFNNCFYFAHGLIGAPWHTSVPQPLADALNTTLAPALTDLRTLGLHYLSHYLQVQRGFILSSMQADGPLTWDYDSLEAFDRTIGGWTAKFRELQRQWLGVLPATMYVRSVSTMAAALCQAALGRLFSTDDRRVDEDLVLVLARRLEMLADEIRKLFRDPLDLAQEIGVWKKFSMLPEVLNAGMLELSLLWEGGSGSLAQVYSCEEIRHVIKMRFPDDPGRLQMLATIQ